jgi:hypothetical protein
LFADSAIELRGVANIVAFMLGGESDHPVEERVIDEYSQYGSGNIIMIFIPDYNAAEG